MTEFLKFDPNSSVTLRFIRSAPSWDEETEELIAGYMSATTSEPTTPPSTSASSGTPWATAALQQVRKLVGTEARREGREAARLGRPRSDIPYPPMSQEGSDWQLGWAEQSNWISKRKGISQENTRRAREQVAKDYAYMEHDPVVEILGGYENKVQSFPEKRDPTDILHTFDPVWDVPDDDQLVEHLVSFGQIVISPDLASHIANYMSREAMAKIMEQMMAVTPFAEKAASLMDAMKNDPDANYTRHRSASECPRHGETKGGTCMKCQRKRLRRMQSW